MSDKQKCLKRKQELLDQTANDFEEEQLNFRFPKRVTVENGTNDTKKRGRRPKTISSLKSGTQKPCRSSSDTQRLSQSSGTHRPSKSSGTHRLSQSSGTQESRSSPTVNGIKKIIVTVNSPKGTKECNSTAIWEDVSSPLSFEHSSPQHSREEDFSDLSELEKSVCSSTEKLCPSCKRIVLVDEYSSHVSTCLQRFSYSKNEKNLEEKDSRILPCPVCLKTFTSATEKNSHVKICGLNHGLSTEQLILASRLQEKQDQERLALGLPSPQIVQAESNIRKKSSSSRPRSKKSSHPDLELAYALSRSLAEEETKKREREEDKLLSLGLHDVIQEKRRKLVLPQPPPQASGSRLGRGKKKAMIQTPLMTRTKEERERIITEKVAAILTGEIDLVVLPIKENKNRVERIPRSLNQLEDKEATLWNLTGKGMEVPLERYFVPNFEKYIQPVTIGVGELLKSYSNIPGRLNYTALVEDSDEDEPDEEDIETTIVDAYCTQLVLAEMLCTQELDDFTFSECDAVEKKDVVEVVEEGEGKKKRISQFVFSVDKNSKEKGINEKEIDREKDISEGNVNKENEINEEEDLIKEKEVNECINKDRVINEDNYINKEKEVNEENINMEVINEEESINKVKEIFNEEKQILERKEEYEYLEITKEEDIINKEVKESNTDDAYKYRNEKEHENLDELERDIQGIENCSRNNSQGAISNHSNNDTLIYKSSNDANDGKGAGNHQVLLVELSSEDETTSTCSFHSTSFNKNDEDLVGAVDHHALDSAFNRNSHQNRALSFPSAVISAPLEPFSEPTQSALRSKFVYDWSCLLANGDHSDIVILTSDGEIAVHFLVLATRCTEILKDVSERAQSQTLKDYQGKTLKEISKKYINWIEMNYDAAYAFVVYLYSGVCNVQPKSEIWLGLFELAIKYKCKELVEYLESVYKRDSISEEVPNKVDSPMAIESPLRNPKNQCVDILPLNKTSGRSRVTELIPNESASPDIFGDWDGGERSRTFIDSPNVTPPGANIRASILKSLKSPVLDLSDSLPELDLEEKKSGDAKLEEKTTSENLIDNEDIFLLDGNEVTCFAEEKTDASVMQKDLDRSNNSTILYANDSSPSYQQEINEASSSNFKSVIRRNLSCEFKELRSPPKNLSHSDSSLNETMHLDKLQLTPASDVDYPRGNEVVDLTISSDSEECPKLSSVGNSPPMQMSPYSVEKDIITCDVISPISNSRTLVNDIENTSRFSALFDNPIQNRLESATERQQFDFQLEIPDLLTEEVPIVKGIIPSPSSRISTLCSASKYITEKTASPESPQLKDNFQSISDESLLNVVCTFEKDGLNSRTSKSKSFQKPAQKFYKSKSCSIASSSSILTPDKRLEDIRPKITITPMPDYKSMVSPDLKKELDKYGIRKLSRKKAVTLLLHIYDQMHPLVTDSEAETSFADTPIRKAASYDSEKGKKNGKKAKGKENNPNAESSEDELDSSQTSNTSVESGFECLEETVCGGDLQEDVDVITPTQQTSLETQMKTFIRSDLDLYAKILSYEPIWANELLKDLKLNGIKCTLAKLIAFLDEQCITFRLPTRERTRKRPRKNSSPEKVARKRRNLKK